MGFLIKIDGAAFDEKYVIGKVDVPDEPIVPVIPVEIADYPVQDGLQGLYDLGGTAEATLTNHAQNPTYQPSGGTPKLEGAYEMADNYVTFSGVANKCRMATYLRLPLDGGLTFVALFSATASDGVSNRPIISNRSTTGGIGLGNHQFEYVEKAVNEKEVYADRVGTSDFTILAMTADTSGYKVCRYSSGELKDVGVIAGNTDKCTGIDAWSTNAIQIGGDSTGTPYTTARISLAAIHTGKLTDEQLESVCKFVYKYGKQKGLTIV